MNSSANKILDYWLDNIDEDPENIAARNALWWSKSTKIDQYIEKEFADEMSKAQNDALNDWLVKPEGRLAVIILLDQFSRNVYRNSARAFAYDKKALALAVEGVELGQDKELSLFQRVFFYIPFEHAEDRALQEKSVFHCQQLCLEAPELLKKIFTNFYDFAQKHKVIIDEYGRFPHRNKILGRVSTEQENVYLSDPNAGF